MNVPEFNPFDESMLPFGQLFQINISQGGVPKQAIQSAQVTSLGIEGDRQTNLDVHGGPERAVCLYALEKLLALQDEGHPVYPGALGENLTLAGVDWEQVVPGVRLQLGSAVLLEVTKYTNPCNSLRPYFINQEYGRVSHNQHPGWSRVYTRVLQTGRIQVGDKARLVP